jgi:uncharacterized protein (DUF2336 family)
MNVTISEKLPEIFNLARERHEEGRIKLARVLTDVFLSDVTLSDREQLMVNEIIDELICNTTPQVKQMLAERLALSTQVPHRVLFNLATDRNAEVASPVLRASKRLKDEDLIYAIEAQSPDHAGAIAQRANISEAVVDALIATGDTEVMVCVAENLGAKISPRAMNSLVEICRFSKKLHEPMSRRPELTKDMGLRLYWWTNTDLRRKIAGRFGIGHGQIDQALEHAIGDLLSNVSADHHDDFAMLKVAEWFNERDAITPRAMIQTLRMGFFNLFNLMLSIRTGLEHALIDRMNSEDGGHTISVLCRAIGVDKPSFVSIFLLSRGARPGEQIVNPRELSGALAAFDRLNTQAARQLVDSWKEDPSYLVTQLRHAAN